MPTASEHPPATPELTLTEFLLARIAEDEAAARAVPPLTYNADMGGNRQDEKFVFYRNLPSSADGMGNVSKHRYDSSTRDHFGRHMPSRVLAECEAKRRIVELHEEDVYPGHLRRPTCFVCANWNEADYDGPPHVDWPCPTLRILAAVYADHPDYRQEWKP